MTPPAHDMAFPLETWLRNRRQTRVRSAYGSGIPHKNYARKVDSLEDLCSGVRSIDAGESGGFDRDKTTAQTR